MVGTAVKTPCGMSISNIQVPGFKFLSHFQFWLPQCIHTLGSMWATWIEFRASSYNSALTGIWEGNQWMENLYLTVCLTFK